MIRTITYRNHQLELGRRTQIMGILNVTPDSFSDGGAHPSIESAVEHAFRMVEDGADLIDIGGESTRPGAVEVLLEEELERVIPVIQALNAAGLPVPISIDTYKPEVADEAVKAGAAIINDIWGFRRDSRMAEVAGRHGCPVILMHNRKEPVYDEFVPEVLSDLQTCISIARAAGVAEENIILDPGIGFGKTYEHNLKLMNRLKDVVDLGYPVLLGTSRKSMVFRTLNLPTHDLIEGTAATIVLGIAQGCDIVRVHDVKQMKRAAAMTDAIVRMTD